MSSMGGMGGMGGGDFPTAIIEGEREGIKPKIEKSLR